MYYNLSMENINLLQRKINIYGTKVSIKVYGLKDEKILDVCEQMLYDFNKIFSIYDKDSELYKVNQSPSNTKIYLSDDLYKLIKVGIDHSKNPQTNMNILLGPLVKLWNIGFDDARKPSNDEIATALSYTNPHDIVLDDTDKSIIFLKDNMIIDLGSLAKGYICDKVIDFLEASGVISAIVNLGGNIRTLGLALHQKDYSFHIGIQNPIHERGDHILSIKLDHMSVVTSGIYERKYEYEGNFYHHIFNPSTGYSIESNMASISIISKTSLMGEIWTTNLFGKCLDDIKEIGKSNPYIDIIVVDKDQNVFYTPGVEKYIYRKENQ